MLIKRRDFLKTGSMVTASLFVPEFLQAMKRKPVPPGNKVVVVLQLSGGNDGLNTVIPIENDIYYKGRPGISVAKNKALHISADAGLHPSLGAIHDLYDAGHVGILNSVGYPNPDRSHFRSMDIWQSASNSNDYVSTGWIGRYLDSTCDGCDRPTHALEIDDVLSLALKGNKSKGMAFKDPKRLYNTSKSAFLREVNKEHYHDHELTDYLYKTLADTQSSAEYIYDRSQQSFSLGQYPDTELGRSLRIISSLVLSDVNTRVYYLSLGSFDSHINQPALQSRLFGQLNAAIKAFSDDMKKNRRFEDVLLMTFSEFGRRVAQNASNGTDHGAANNMFFISGGLKKSGMINSLPDLSNLVNGDIKHTVDFKSVYATVLKKWLSADDQKILGGNFPHLDFI